MIAKVKIINMKATIQMTKVQKNICNLPTPKFSHKINEGSTGTFTFIHFPAINQVENIDL